jgi:hypothetical protein
LYNARFIISAQVHYHHLLSLLLLFLIISWGEIVQDELTAWHDGTQGGLFWK